MKEIDGVAIYGHMDYGKKAPDLGWRFTDAWLSMAGAGDKGLPNGKPVDEWGIRVDGCRPVGASVSRGGAANGPAAKYSLRKYMEWLRKYAPPGALGMDFYQSLPSLAKGNVAQQIFWYTAFTASMVEPRDKGNNTVDENGKPLWRMAPSPHGPYWEEGMKLGYQDAGSWTLLKSTPVDRRKAAWLFAQFTVSKIGVAQEVAGRPDHHPRQRHQLRGVHRARALPRRAGGVLSQPGARHVDAERHQRAGLSEAGATVVAEHRRGGGRRGHAVDGDGQPGRRAGQDPGPHRALRRPGRMRSQAEPGARPGVLARASRARPSPSSKTKSPRARPSTTTS